MTKEYERKDGERLLLIVSWIAAFLPYIFSPIAFGPIAFCLGVVLKRDYDVGNQGKLIMTFGVVNTVGGIIFANWLISTLS